MGLKSRANEKVDQFRKNKESEKGEESLDSSNDSNLNRDLMDEMFPEPSDQLKSQEKKNLKINKKVVKAGIKQKDPSKKAVNLSDIFEKLKEEGGVKNLPKRTHYYPDIYHELLKKARLKEGLYENSYEHFISILDNYVRQFPGYQETMEKFFTKKE